MKVLVIPDIHLKPWIFDEADKAVKKVKPDCVLLLGDLPDDFGCKNNAKAYNDTFDRAIQFEHDHPDALWCYGNHECSYLWDRWTNGMAFHAKEAARDGVHGLYKEIPQDHLKFVYRIDNVLFSHAGVCKYFLDDETYFPDKENIDEVVETINTKIHVKQMWDDVSPIWVRPQGQERFGIPLAMWQPHKLMQVVGHTPMEQITHEKNEKMDVLSCDVFSTYRNGRPIGTEQFCLIDTISKEWQGIQAEHHSYDRSDGRKS